MPAESDDDSLGQEFSFVREHAAPRESVFNACTDPRHVAQWWGPTGFTNPVCEWDARPGGNLYVVMRATDGTEFPMGGKVHEVVPPEKLVTTTGALDENGKLQFEFRHALTLAEMNGKTKLTLHSQGDHGHLRSRQIHRRIRDRNEHDPGPAHHAPVEQDRSAGR